MVSYTRKERFMKIFFASDSLVSIRNEAGEKIGVTIDTANYLKEKILSLLQFAKHFVFIVNESQYIEHNENSARLIFEELCREGVGLIDYVVLDDRNKSQAKNILSKADFVFLQGGIIAPQLQFLKDIDFVQVMKDSDAVVLGKSAGAMVLQDVVYNYPETNEDVSNPRWLDGLGYSRYMLIPHFNLDTGNLYCFGDFNLLNDYYIPDSKGKVLYGIPNGSYIYLEDGVFTLYGEAYTIADGNITKICENEKYIVLE